MILAKIKKATKITMSDQLDFSRKNNFSRDKCIPKSPKIIMEEKFEYSKGLLSCSEKIPLYTPNPIATKRKSKPSSFMKGYASKIIAIEYTFFTLVDS